MRFKQLKALYAVLASLVLIISTGGSAVAGSWTPPFNSDLNTKGVNLVDSFINTGESMSSLMAVTGGGETSATEAICTTLQVSEPCKFGENNGWFLHGTILLGKCKTADEMNCIESLSIGSSATDIKDAEFLRMTDGPETPAIESLGLTAGSSSSLWQSDVVHAGGKATYSAFVSLKVSFNVQTKRVSYSNLTAAINPYTEITGAKYRTPFLHSVTQPNGKVVIGRAGGERECSWTSAGLCGLTEEFTPGTFAGMKLHLTKEITGWFSGRLSSPTVQINSINSTTNLVSITGSSVQVPRFAAFVPKSTPLPNFDRVMSSNPGWIGGMLNTRTDDLNNVVYLEDFRTIVNDTSSGVNDVWNINTVRGVSNPCFTDTSKVHGIVTTNSLLYSGQSPTFSNQTIDYSVAGLHFLPDGVTPVEGSYDLVMRSETARCLYGFSTAPLSATISVTNSNGEAKTATTSFVERSGWVYFKAQGFTFSEPKITVKLSQSKPAKKTTITCVTQKKPIKTKKITGVAPKCPTGFKKK